MKFDPITIIVAVIILVAACASILVWIIYENIIKSETRTIKYKYDTKNNEFEALYKKLNNRMNKLEETTETMLKDISEIKKRLNM